jgi:hypothetical protein
LEKLVDWFFPETIYKLTATYLENVDRSNRCQFAMVLMERNFRVDIDVG